MTDLRLGDYREVLADVHPRDAVPGTLTMIVDPPYGETTHKGHNAGVADANQGDYHKAVPRPGRNTHNCGTSRRRDLDYGFWTPDDVREFVDSWAPRINGWFCAFSCSDLSSVWRQAFKDASRTAFAPVPCVITGMSVRLAGDGPSNWAIYLNVSRPKNLSDRGAEPIAEQTELPGIESSTVRSVRSTWGTLPGAYIVRRNQGSGSNHIGGKPLDLMRAIVRDYSNAGDLVVDPCAGFATTAIAAEGLKREFVGAEIDRDTYRQALERLTAGVQFEMFGG